MSKGTKKSQVMEHPDSQGHGFMDMLINGIIKFGVYILAFVLGVSAKWATRYKDNISDRKVYVYDGVIAASATFVAYHITKYMNRPDIAPFVIFFAARFGDAFINLVWIKIKATINNSKIEGKEDNQ